MEKKSLDQMVKSSNYLKSLMQSSIIIPRQEILQISKQQLNYYKSFPDIYNKHKKLQNKVSQIIKKIGNFIGVQTNKGLIKLQKTSEIVDQYTDNIQILIKKMAEQEQKLRIKKKRQNQQPLPSAPRIQQIYNLQKPIRRQMLNQINLQLINANLQISLSAPINTNFIFVDSQLLFNEMLSALSISKQIAVDLEHSDKTYTGVTCLMQISTRTQDYIIDVFPVWPLLNKLNKIFNNQNILKVFHGADSDIVWLHRDFDVRVINMFDTHQAARVLGHKQHSYAYLLKYYTQTDTDKKYQLADWRIRPLSQQMLLYARIDTHYLLEIYDKMKNDLYKKSIESQLDFLEVLKTVWMRSYDVCCFQYKETNYKYCQPYLSIIEKHRAFQSQQKLHMMEKIFEIREKLAKQEDQNTNELFPRKYIFELADKKNFEIKWLEIYLKKAPQKLKKHLQTLSNALSSCYNQLVMRNQSNEKKMQIQQQTIPNLSNQIKINKIKQVEFEGMQLQQLYFQFQKHDISFRQYQCKNFKQNIQIEKKIINFQCPLDFLMEKYQVMKQQQIPEQNQTIIQYQPLVETKVEQIQQKEQKVIYFNEEKQKKTKEVQIIKYEPRISKKRKKQNLLQKKIGNSTNVYNYFT